MMLQLLYFSGDPVSLSASLNPQTWLERLRSKNENVWKKNYISQRGSEMVIQ